MSKISKYFDVKLRRSRSRLIKLSEKDKELIDVIYWAASYISEYTGIPHEVDHIIPIVNDKICGLHVPENLQILTRRQNYLKSNKWN